MYRNSKHTILFPLILAAGIVLGILFGQFVGRNRAESQLRTLLSRSGLQTTNKIMQTCALIEHQFVDSISMDSLSELVIPLMMQELDPHSVYIPARQMQAVNEPLEGEFDGIGVSFNAATDTVLVLSVIPNGPSAKAGLAAGDRIIKVNDTLVSGVKMAQDDIVKRLRGPRGTEVKLSLERRGIEDLVDVTVVRDAIPIKSIESAFMVTPDIAFIRLSQFARTSHTELMEALQRLRGEGMTKLIFDLRGNSGGYMDQAILIANEFLPEGELIVYTEDRNKHQIKEFSDGRGTATDIALAVLIDEGSASSSEILAGAVQDNDRGTIVGRRSFGKGLVQHQIPYSDGSALRLTVARYYTPTGRSIQKPYVNGDEYDYEMDIVRRYRNNEFFSADSIHFADSLRFVTPKGKVVYGGGGIMPDYFVPLDTTKYTKMHRQLAAKSIVFNHSLKFIDAHRKELKSQYKDFNKFLANYEVPSSLIDAIIAEGKKEKIEPKDEAELAQTKKYLAVQLKALVARDIWDMSQYFQVWNETNEIVQRAVKLLTTGK